MATMTITTDAQQAQRVAAAVGSELSLGRDATMAEVKGFTIAFLRRIVQFQERRAAEAEIADTPFDPT